MLGLVMAMLNFTTIMLFPDTGDVNCMTTKKADCRLFRALPKRLDIWNSHGDKITKLLPGFRIVATSENSNYAVFEDPKRKLYALQFHPEVVHTPRGREILENFVHLVCGCEKDWTMGSFIESSCADRADECHGLEQLIARQRE